MIDLKGKKILFVSPKAFGYEIEIKKKLTEYGALVDYFDERPSNSTWVKACIRINRKLIKKLIHKYYNKIIKINLDKQFEYIFFIHLETPFPSILSKLKKVNEKGFYILYMWDSMLHRPNTLELTKYFDRVYTYDRLDSINYGFIFRPLFFLDAYTKFLKKDACVDISFIGTIHSDRYKIIKNIKKQSNNLKLKTKWFLYIHNKLLYYKFKFSNISNFTSNINEFSFKPLGKSEVVRRIQEAKAILDIQHPENNGLTMRTLEIMGANKKLITTNKDIVNYDFYHPNNIFVIDRKKPLIDNSFFETEFSEISIDILENYSLKSWINDIFNNNPN